MTENAVMALLNEPNAKTRIGLRDRTLMIFLYDSGARISEALGVRLCDIRLGSSPQVLLFGKGNKVRTVPIDGENGGASAAIPMCLPQRRTTYFSSDTVLCFA